MRRQDALPLNLFVAKEAVICHGAGPVAAGLSNTGRELGALALAQPVRALIASGISQINTFQFRGNPADSFSSHKLHSSPHCLLRAVRSEMS